MQTSGKEARFRFPECSLLYAKAMQTRTVGRDDVHIVSAVDSRVQLAFCKVSANRVKGKGKRDIYLLGAVRAAWWVRRPRRRRGARKMFTRSLAPPAIGRMAAQYVPFRAAERAVSRRRTACFALPNGRCPQASGCQELGREVPASARFQKFLYFAAARPHGIAARRDW